MPRLHPSSPGDRVIGPMLLDLDRSLGRLRGCPDLASELDLDGAGHGHLSPQTRVARVIRAATRDVDLRGLTATPSPGLDGISVQHGSYRVTLMLGGRLASYVRDGVVLPEAVTA